MEIPKFVFYKKRTYRLQTSGRYYQDHNRCGVTERLLHRVIWKEHRGDIPDGFHVHHKNGDWRDNRISNLALVKAGEHISGHLKERFKDPEFRKRNRKHLDKAIAMAVHWHKSEAGHLWHVEHGKKSVAARLARAEIRKCKRCGSDFKMDSFGQKFCSVRCRDRNKIETVRQDRMCAYCGNIFSAFKYSGTINCSKKCASLSSRKTRSSLQPDAA